MPTDTEMLDWLFAKRATFGMSGIWIYIYVNGNEIAAGLTLREAIAAAMKAGE